MPVIAEIAELLGLSRSTVISALRGEPGIARPTVDAVRDLAAELGVTPAARQALERQTSQPTIGVVVPSVERWFYTAVLSGITRFLTETRFDVVLFDLSRHGNDRREFNVTSLASRADALIVISTDFTHEEWIHLLSAGLPVIAVGAPTPGIRRIGIDDYQAAHLVTERVIAVGHTQIGYLGGYDSHTLNTTSVNDRERAFRDVLDEHSLDLPREWVLSGEYRMGTAHAVVEAFLHTKPLPTALVCASDEMALGAMYAIAATGRRVGGEISVVGIDGHEYSNAFGLATAQQFPEEQGMLAAQTLVAELDGAPAQQSFVPARWTFIDRPSLGPVTT